MQSRTIKKIACVGEVMIELIVGEENNAKLSIAGDTYNTAVYLKRLLAGDDCDVSYVTALGKDGFSDRIIDAVKLHDLNASHIDRLEDKMPGLYAIETDENGERSFSYWRGQAAAKNLFAENAKMQVESLADFDLIYISGITMAILPPSTRERIIEFIDGFRSAGGQFAFDSNYRPKLWENQKTAQDVTSTMWSLSDIALPSIDDEMALFGDQNEGQVLDRLKSSGISFGALKRGVLGPLSLGGSQSNNEYPKVTRIVDTTAAGDSFNAGFLAAYTQGKDIGEALKTGHDLASKVIQQKGAIIDF